MYKTGYDHRCGLHWVRFGFFAVVVGIARPDLASKIHVCKKIETFKLNGGNI